MAERTFKQLASVFVYAILGGFSITIGSTAFLYLYVSNCFIGSFLFGYGLLTIITLKMWLYTGKVGFAIYNPSGYCYIADLISCIIGNYIGLLILAAIVKESRIGDTLKINAKSLIITKQEDKWYSIFILSMMCGIMITLAFKGHETCSYGEGKAIFTFLAIMIFSLCRYEECITNGVFYVYAGDFDGDCFGNLLLMILGNTIGALLLDFLFKVGGYLYRPPKPKVEVVKSNDVELCNNLQPNNK